MRMCAIEFSFSLPDMTYLDTMYIYTMFSTNMVVDNILLISKLLYLHEYISYTVHTAKYIAVLSSAEFTSIGK